MERINANKNVLCLGDILSCILLEDWGGHHISCVQKADVALFWSCALRFRAVIIVSVSTSEKKPHASASFFSLRCCVWQWIRYFAGCFEYLQIEKVSFDYGGLRGSRIKSAPPDCPPLRSSQQRVCNLKERHATYWWSGKESCEESLLEVVQLLLRDRSPDPSTSALEAFSSRCQIVEKLCWFPCTFLKFNRILNIGQSFPNRRFLLVKGGAVTPHTKCKRWKLNKRFTTGGIIAYKLSLCRNRSSFSLRGFCKVIIAAFD